VGSACLLAPMRPPEDFKAFVGVSVVFLLVVGGVVVVDISRVVGRNEGVDGLSPCLRARAT
jgi:hypothetical protein